MCKLLFKAVFWIMVIMGSLLIWAVNATNVTITYDLNWWYWVENKSTESKNVTYTWNDEKNIYETTERWRTPSKYDSDGKKWMFDWWYIDQSTTKKRVTAITWNMTLYAKRLEFNDQTFTYNGVEVTIMDRDLWNWNHFQWWNNYWFKPCSKWNYYDELWWNYYCTGFPNKETVNNSEQKIMDYVSTYYSNMWNSNSNSIFWNNLRWWGSSSNPDEDKQWPCPEWYHVPDILELNKWSNKPASSENMGTRYHKICYWEDEPDENYASCMYATVYFQLYYKSSKYWFSNSNSYDKLNWSYVRCFKNTETKTINFDTNWWDDVQSMQTSRWRENAITLPTPTYWNKVFGWWYTMPDWEWTKVTTNAILWDTDTIILYAKWTCNPGYKENEERTACEIINYNIKYELDEDIENANPEIYTIESDNINLINPSKSWYNFVWRSGTDIDWLSRFVTIKKWSTWDRTYEANWQKNPWYTFDANWWVFDDWSIKYITKYNNEQPQIYYTWCFDNKWFAIENLCNQNKWRFTEVIKITWTNKLHIELRWYARLSNANSTLFICSWEYTWDFTNNFSWYLYKISNWFENLSFDIWWDTITLWMLIPTRVTPSYYVIVYPDGKYIINNEIKEPVRNWYKFLWWSESWSNEIYDFNLPIIWDKYFYAKWKCAQWYVDKQWQCVKEETKPSWGSSGGWWGWGWWGGSSSSCKNLPANAVANNNSKPSSNTNYYYSTNTSKVCTFQCKSGYTRNEEKETCDKVSDSQTISTWTTVKEPEGTWNNTKVETWNNAEIQTWSQEPLSPSDSSPDREQTVTPLIGRDSEARGGWTTTYSTEFQQAYEFAHENGITTKNTIESADMNGKLTRIAMAKMLSQYAINVLWKTPDTSNTKKFDDVSDKRDADYDNGVILAYQLWIMWQNMANNFRPDDEVTRAEFATALSRMLYNTSDGEYKSTAQYYVNHMKKLKEEWIITKDDPKMKELRGYVMIMLMRSAK